jgi:RNA polymerase sigma factor (sigma-70 family)
VQIRLWLGRILRNKVRTTVRFWRRDKRNSVRESPLGQELSAFGDLIDPAAAVAENEAFAWAMAALPEDQRVVIELFLLHDMTMREAAEAIGISEDCARKRYERGLAFLKPLLERESGATANLPGP